MPTPLAARGVALCPQRLSFSCWIVAYSRKTLLESSEIFVEHTPQVARILFRTQDNQPASVDQIWKKFAISRTVRSTVQSNPQKRTGNREVLGRVCVVFVEQYKMAEHFTYFAKKE